MNTKLRKEFFGIGFLFGALAWYLSGDFGLGLMFLVLISILAWIDIYVVYAKDNPKHLWFKNKLYGWGWTPVTWQGWIVTLVYIVLVLVFALSIDESSPAREVMFTFALPAVLLTIVFIRIAYKKGERPHWQWGLPKEKMKQNLETVVFGGGCFWCTEAVFKMIKGVISVVPGYAGGEKENPSYFDVGSGETGHAEVIKVEYDPEKITFRELLTVFFGSHDPTTLNRQGADVGTQYRSIILVSDKKQEEEAKKFIEELNSSNEKGASIVTEVKLLDKFYEAENYHKDYYESNKENRYCELVINPKLEKVQKEFAELLKNQ